MRAVTPWRPMRELESLRKNMEDAFDSLTERVFGASPSGWGTGGWVPSIESHVANGNLVVKVDLPGIDPKEVTLSVSGQQLRIEGERKREEKKEEKDYYYQEVSYGKFARVVPLPEGTDVEKVKASYKDGVLEITLPAPKGVSSKKVPIETTK